MNVQPQHATPLAVGLWRFLRAGVVTALVGYHRPHLWDSLTAEIVVGFVAGQNWGKGVSERQRGQWLTSQPHSAGSRCCLLKRHCTEKRCAPA